MAIFLAATVVDVLDAAQTPKRIGYAVGDTDATPLTATSTKGVFEVALPDDHNELKLFVTADGFWGVTQDIKIDRSGAQPTASYGAKQHLNVRGVPTVHSRGTTDFTVEVEVVLGHLRDASGDVEPFTTAGGGNNRFTLGPQGVERFENPALDPNGRGLAALKKSVAAVDLTGPVFFIERVGFPRFLVAIDPGWPGNPGDDPKRFPVHFHLMFPPTTPGDWQGDYFLSDPYIDFPSRYLILPFNKSGKQLAYQNVAKSHNSIMVFPVADTGQQLNELRSQKSLMRLFFELNYFYQRMRGSKMARRKVGHVDLSAFSNGTSNLTPIMTGASYAPFQRALRMVCILDGLGSEAQPIHPALVKWHDNGSNDRHLRIYTQFDNWLIFAPSYPNATVTTGKDGAKEWEAPGFTLLYLPLPFWQVDFPQFKTWKPAHQVFPAFFLEHAMSSSQV